MFPFSWIPIVLYRVVLARNGVRRILSQHGCIASADAAAKREKQIKGWIRKKKIALIEKENPRWHDLSPMLQDYGLK